MHSTLKSTDGVAVVEFAVLASKSIANRKEQNVLITESAGHHLQEKGDSG